MFGPVWAVLYVLIALSFGFAFLQVARHRWPRRVAVPFAINLASNLLFSPIQFRLQNNVLALLDIFIILGSIVWAMKTVWPHSGVIAYVQVPYLLWVGFATVLQTSVTYLNW